MKANIPFIVVFVALLAWISIPTKAQNANMTCGQGITLRTAGVVNIDGWKSVDLAGQRLEDVSRLVAKEYPERVIIGLSVNDSSNLCLETVKGSTCFSMKEVRSKLQ